MINATIQEGYLGKEKEELMPIRKIGKGVNTMIAGVEFENLVTEMKDMLDGDLVRTAQPG